MKKHSLPYKNSIISFKQAGSGKQLLFCFHGFGEDGHSFGIFEKLLGNEFTLIATDFPFHGETAWKEGLHFQPADLLDIISTFTTHFAREDIQPAKFSVLAYSLGGRIAFHLLQLIPEKIDRMVLAAPDGLTMNFWYWLGTQTWLGNKVFKFTILNPGWFFFLVKVGNKTGLVNKSICKFVYHYIDDEKARFDLYQRWTSMRKFRPDFKRVITALNNHPTRLCLFFGVYDRIILSKRSDFLKTACPKINIKIIQAGHQLLREKHAKEIAAAFSE